MQVKDLVQNLLQVDQEMEVKVIIDSTSEVFPVDRLDPVETYWIVV